MAELDPLGPILGVLFDDGSSDYILKVLSLAGVPAHFGLSAKETYSNSTRKRAYLDRLPQVLAKFSEAQRIQVAENVARELGGDDLTRPRLEEVLHNVGWTLSEGKLTALAQAGKPARGGAPTPDLPQHAESDGPAAGSNAPTSTLHLPAQPTAAFPNAPRVLVSYSWDSEQHKEWVLALATRLRGDGIDAIIDETHLPLGARSPEFMERSVRECGCALVVCTETYKQRFDNRKGGAGYEGHIITGEIINEVGENKFIPVLRSGNWEIAMPTALSGVRGVDLRSDSPDEYQKLVKRLHGISDVPRVGRRPEWLDGPSDRSDRPVVTRPATMPDLNEFWEQRKRLKNTDILERIWSKPRWFIWICPTGFRKARFRSLEQCREFMHSSYVSAQGLFPYPWFSTDSIETGDEWIAGEIDLSDGIMRHAERWTLLRSGQFVHHRAFDDFPQLADHVHVLQILDTATAALEFAARMAHRGVMSPEVVITFELIGLERRGLTWPDRARVDRNAVGPNCWCKDKNVSVKRLVGTDELEARRRGLALEVALEIYARFGWSDPPIQRLTDEQGRRFGAV